MFLEVVSNGSLNGAATVNGGLLLGRGVTSPILDHVPNGPLSLNAALASLNTTAYPNISSPNSPIIPNTGKIYSLATACLLPNKCNSYINLFSDINGLSTTTPTTGMNSYSQPRVPNVRLNAMQIRCKFGQLGAGKGQFNSPHGFCLGAEEDIIVADTNNHRIQVSIVKMISGSDEVYYFLKYSH